jgi:succinate---hydroxymethylglutarate CoA-transferase
MWREAHFADIQVSRAEVIKIEHPTRGDDTRAWGPPFAKYSKGDDARAVGPPFAKYLQDESRSGPGESAYFIAVGIN